MAHNDEAPSHLPAGLAYPLQPLAEALKRASTVERVADALVVFGRPALDACVASVAILNEAKGEFFCPRIVGYPDGVADTWRRFSAGARYPIAEAVRLNRPVLLETWEQRAGYYPVGTPLPPLIGRSLAAVPFRHGDVVGGLGFTFPDERRFDENDVRRLEALGDLCAAALAKVRRGGLGCEVLVVDDEDGVLGLLDFALRSHAFTVRAAIDGARAVELYRQHKATVAVALIDVQMPHMDGPATLAALRAITPDLRCVFMSGHTGRYTADELLAMGADRVMQKPFRRMDAVVQAIREVGCG